MMKRILISLILIFCFNLAFLLPTFGQTIPKESPTSFSYIPSNPNLKDEQNIDYLYEAIITISNVAKSQSDASDKIEDDLPENRESLANFYYSQEEGAFEFREFSKLVRGITCKASRISGVRGMDLSNKMIGLLVASTKDVESFQDQPPIDSESGLILLKSAYENFCPDLW